MDKPTDIITKLLPQAEMAELQEFLQRLASKHTALAVDLGQLLMSKYAHLVNDVDIYVTEVKRLFCLKEDKFRGNHRHRNYLGVGLNGIAINEGMENIANTLRQKLADGYHQLVTPPVVEFYRLLTLHLSQFLMEDKLHIDSATKACDKLLLEWVKCPAVSLEEKQDMFCTLKELAKPRITQHINGLSNDFLLIFRTYIQRPQEILDFLDKLSKRGPIPSALVIRHIALLRQFDRKEDAQRVIRRNLYLLPVLDAELDHLYECGADDAALKLLDLAKKYYKSAYLIKEKRTRFMERLGETKELIELYRYLLLNPKGNIEYFHKLKALVPPAEWPAQYSLIVKEGTAAKCSPHTMAEIHAAEGDLEALSKALMCTQLDILNKLLLYLPQMPEQYHAPLLQKGIEHLEAAAHMVDKRVDYIRIVDSIRSFATLPQAQPLVDALVARLRATFINRPAYLEELNML